MIKYIIVIVVVVVIGGYCVTVLCNNGMRQLEEAASINKKAEERMKLVEQIMKNGLEGGTKINDDKIDNNISYVVESKSIVLDQNPEKYKGTTIKVGDTESKIYETVGVPEKTDYVNDYKYIKYSNVKFAVLNSRIIAICR